MKNIRRLAQLNWLGRYGFYEAVDHSGGEPHIMRYWMAHHQGMSLLAICNVLHTYPFQRYFHAEPAVMATELLLNERLPAAVLAQAREPGFVRP